MYLFCRINSHIFEHSSFNHIPMYYKGYPQMYTTSIESNKSRLRRPFRHAVQIPNPQNHINDVMVSFLASSVVDRGFEQCRLNAWIQWAVARGSH